MEVELLKETFTDLRVNIFENVDVIKRIEALNAVTLNTARASHFKQNIDSFYLVMNGQSNKLAYLSEEQLELIKLYNADLFLIDGVNEFIKNTKKYVSSPSELINTVQNYVKEFHSVKERIYRILKDLTPIKRREISIPSDKAILELVFQGDRGVDEMVALNRNIHDWFVIFGGYAEALGIKKEDFEVLDLHKNSPLKAKILMGLKAFEMITAITVSLFEINNQLQVQRDAIEYAKRLEVSNEKMKKELIKDAQEKYKIQLGEIVQSAVKKCLDENKIEATPENLTKLNTVVIKQQKFINQGGVINIIAGSTVKEIDQKVIYYREKQSEFNKSIDTSIVKSLAPIEDEEDDEVDNIEQQ